MPWRDGRTGAAVPWWPQALLSVGWLLAATFVSWSGLDRTLVISTELPYMRMPLPWASLALGLGFGLLAHRVLRPRCSWGASASLGVAASIAFQLLHALVVLLNLQRDAPLYGAGTIYNHYLPAYGLAVFCGGLLGLRVWMRRHPWHAWPGMPAMLLALFVALELAASGQWGLLAAVGGVALAPEPAIRAVRNGAVRLMDSPRLMTWLLCAAAFALRWLWAWRLISLSSSGDEYIRASDDGLSHHQLALALVSGTPDPTEMYWPGFGYWYFLAGVYRFFGVGNFQAVVLAQALVSSLAVLAVVQLGRMFFGRRSAYLAGLATALNVNLIWLGGVIGLEALYVPVFALGTYLIIRGYRRDRYASLRSTAEAALGLLAINLIRQEAILVPLLIGVLLAVFDRRALGWRRIGRITATFIVAVAAALSLIGLRRVQAYGQFRVFPTCAAAAFTDGPVLREYNLRLSAMGFNPFKDPGRAAETFLREPLTVSRLLVVGTARRAAYNMFTPNFGLFDPIYLTPPGWTRFEYPRLLSFYALLLFLTGLGGFWARYGRSFEGLFLIGLGVYSALVYAVFMAWNPRFRGILEGFFALYGAYGLSLYVRHVARAFTSRSD